MSKVSSSLALESDAGAWTPKIPGQSIEGLYSSISKTKKCNFHCQSDHPIFLASTPLPGHLGCQLTSILFAWLARGRFQILKWVMSCGSFVICTESLQARQPYIRLGQSVPSRTFHFCCTQYGLQASMASIWASSISLWLLFLTY